MKRLLSFLIIIILVSIISGSSVENKEPDSYRQERKINFNSGKNKISQLISEKKKINDFKTVKILEFEKEASQNDNSSEFAIKAFLLNLNYESVSKILKSREQNILFDIPISKNNSMELELTQSFPASPDFILTGKSETGSTTENYVQGLHYLGIIKGKENSTASLSIFKNFVMGLISDETENYVLGSVKNPDNTYSNNYIFYNDADLIVKDNFKCGVDDNEEKFVMAIKKNMNYHNLNALTDNLLRLPVKVYFEADYQMYLDANQDPDVLSNFITGMFNQVMTIYQNESIPFEITGIGYWSGPDPYSNLNNSFDILTNFGANTRDDFEGNIAHLLSTRDAGFGGIAWIRVLCSEFNQGDSSGRFAFSNIDPGYNTYPTYSWTVNVVTHEMGHSLGSRHTHSCVWPIGGTIRAIDSCYYSEGGCFSDNQIRPRVGTIMSYCHLWPVNQGGGINLALGFGPLPGDTIRLRYEQASCLDAALNSSERPSSFILKQNFPNPFNPVTKITFALPVDASVELKVYDVTGKLIANIVQNKFYRAGFYNVEFNSENYDLSSGIYFYSLGAGGELIDTKGMVLIK